MSGDDAADGVLAVSARDGVVTFPVRVQPRSSRERIEGVRAGALRVALAAPPVEGEANAALVALLAKTLGVPRRDLTLVRGATGRTKTVAVCGLSPDEVRTRLGV